MQYGFTAAPPGYEPIGWTSGWTECTIPAQLFWVMPLYRDNLLKRITQHPGRCGGRPCIRGTRLRVCDVVGLIDAGMTQAEVLAEYPYLEADDIRACLIFAALRVSHTEIVVWSDRIRRLTSVHPQDPRGP